MAIEIIPNNQDVLLVCNFNNDGSISLGEGKTETETGDKITNTIYILKNNINPKVGEEPVKVALAFNNKESLDIFINKLLKIKKEFIKDSNSSIDLDFYTENLYLLLDSIEEELFRVNKTNLDDLKLFYNKVSDLVIKKNNFIKFDRVENTFKKVEVL